MKIRKATLEDAENIKNVYMQAFDVFEAEDVSNLAVDLISEKSHVNIISLVAIENDKIVGHVAFSPVFLESTNDHIGYILAPLAVTPKLQNNNIGTSLVKLGLDNISNMGPNMVFVYGDPQYYSRFGFNTELAKRFTPLYRLKYPEGWHALAVNVVNISEGGSITCVDSLNDKKLW